MKKKKPARFIMPVSAIVIGCGASKLDTELSVAAKLLYTGPLFKARLEYAQDEAPFHNSKIFILSALHGLVELEDPLKPYDFTIHQLPRQARDSWANRACERLLSIVKPETILELHLGADYAEPIAREAKAMGMLVTRPTAGLSQGKLLAWYKENASIPF